MRYRPNNLKWIYCKKHGIGISIYEPFLGTYHCPICFDYVDKVKKENIKKMCVVSMVGDDWTRKLPAVWPSQAPMPDPRTPGYPYINRITRPEFEELKQQVEQMKRELEAAKKQDIEDGNPDCEMESKVELLKKVAEVLDVDISDIFE